VDAENAFADAKRAYANRTLALSRVGNSSLRDPTKRLLLSRSALHALSSRADAQRKLYLAGRALEYHVNRSFGDVLGKAALSAFSSDEATRMQSCLKSIFDDSRLSLRTPQEYVTDVSVRKLLGVVGPRVDDVTSQTIDEGEQFRRILLSNQNFDGTGSVTIEFSSNLDPGNLLWSSSVCDDRVTTVDAELVGDFLGDNEAEVDLVLDGGGIIRRCDTDLSGSGSLMSWATSGRAVVQAGVNSFGKPTANASLYGLSVASSQWKLVLPGASAAPSNADLDLTKIDDIVLRVRHTARPVTDRPLPIAFDCLSDVGAGP
jgi:hypothetical protein